MGRCLLLRESSVNKVVSMSQAGLLIAAIGSISILGATQASLMTVMGYAIYSFNVTYWSRFIVRDMLLHEDGEHIALYLHGSTTPKIIKISSIEPKEVEFGKYGTWAHMLKTNEKEQFIILHSSKCTEKEVVQEIFMGENISIDPQQ